MVIVRVQTNDEDIPFHLTNNNIDSESKLKLCKTLSDKDQINIPNFCQKIEILNNNSDKVHNINNKSNEHRHDHISKFKKFARNFAKRKSSSSTERSSSAQFSPRKRDKYKQGNYRKYGNGNGSNSYSRNDFTNT